MLNKILEEKIKEIDSKNKKENIREMLTKDLGMSKRLGFDDMYVLHNLERYDDVVDFKVMITEKYLCIVKEYHYENWIFDDVYIPYDHSIEYHKSMVLKHFEKILEKLFK